MTSPVSHRLNRGRSSSDRSSLTGGNVESKKTKKQNKTARRQKKKKEKKRLFSGAEMTTNSPEVYLKRERARRCRAPERRRISPLTSRLNVKSTAQHFDAARCHLPFYYREKCSIKGCISFIMIQIKQ